MRLIYIDEAGLSRPDDEPFLVVAGVIVDADKRLAQVEHRLGDLVRTYIPSEKQEGFVFHAHELFGGRGNVFDQKFFKPDKRMELAKELAAMPKVFHLPLSYGYIERAKFPYTRPRDPALTDHQLLVYAHVSTFMSCAIRIEQWMRQKTKNEVCAMVVENNDASRKLLKDTQLHHQNDTICATFDDHSKKYFPLKKIREEPWFQEKKQSSPLQLADFCAYIFKRILMDPHRQPYREIFDMLLPKIINPQIPAERSS